MLLDWWRTLGTRGVVPVLIWLVCLTAALGIGINHVAPIARPLHFPDRLGRIAAAVLLALIVVRAERVGVRRWLAGWFTESAEHGGHHHHHGHEAHDHDDAHSSDTPNGSAATKRSPEANGASADA